MGPEMAAAQAAANAVDQAFWQNLGFAITAGFAAVAAILMGVKRYFRQWKDETASSNASSAGVVATQAMNMVVEMLRNELQQMADLYREVNVQRVELLNKVEDLQKQIGKLEREVSKLHRVDSENTRLVFENAEQQTKIQELEHVLASCVQCNLRSPGARTRATDTSEAGAGQAGAAGAEPVPSTDRS